MTAEEEARQKIDRLLDQCGWIVQDHGEMNISAGPGVAIREFPLTTGKADYLLYLDGKGWEVFACNRPDELCRLVGLARQHHAGVRELPPLDIGPLWRIQVKTITSLENPLAENGPRFQIQMATGTGKTYTPVSSVYRIIRYGNSLQD